MSKSGKSAHKVAVIQAGTVFLDPEATLQKALRLIESAAGAGAELMLLPEAFFGGYPRGFQFDTSVGRRGEGGRSLYARYHDSAISLSGLEVEALRRSARTHGCTIAAGIVERASDARTGSLYCSMLVVDESGEIRGVHRKLRPTGAERLIWSDGDGSTLSTCETKAGRIGGLICWENYMPLARMALYQQGIDIYLAPTADNRDGWLATVRHIALEGRCYVLSANQHFRLEDYPAEIRALPELDGISEPFCRGGSAIIDPLGNVIAGPLHDKEGILYATVDPAVITGSRFDFDVAGHYNRPDLFAFSMRSELQ